MSAEEKLPAVSLRQQCLCSLLQFRSCLFRERCLFLFLPTAGLLRITLQPTHLQGQLTNFLTLIDDVCPLTKLICDVDRGFFTSWSACEREVESRR